MGSSVSKFNPDRDIPDLSGKVVLVTGGNNGVGKESVLQLAKHNPKEVFLAARTPSKAEAAMAEIKKSAPNGNVSFIQLDLTSFDSVQKAADEFHRRSDRLDILINNAGVMAQDYSKTKEGYEVQFGTNHMGHALLTRLLLPTLLKTAEKADSDVRVINVSSEGHRIAWDFAYQDQDALAQTSTWVRYGISKLANVLHARELQRRHPTITATAVHPGVILTGLYDHLSWARLLAPLFGLFALDVAGGAKNQLWAATGPREEVREGWYWKPVAVANPGSKQAQDEKLAAEFWDWTEEQLKKHE